MIFIFRILLTAILVVFLSRFLPGVSISGYGAAIMVAIVLSLLNLIVKPILILFTLPVTILTLGLFLLVINAIIILMADAFVSGFNVNGFWVAMLFSIILTFTQSLLFSLIERN